MVLWCSPKSFTLKESIIDSLHTLTGLINSSWFWLVWANEKKNMFKQNCGSSLTTHCSSYRQQFQVFLITKFWDFFTPLYHYRFFASWHTRPSPISGKNKRFFFVLRIRLIRRDIKFDSRYLFLAGGVCGKCKTPSRNNLIKKWTTCKNVAWNLPSYVSSMDLTWKLSLNRFVISFLNVKFLIILTFKS